MNRLVYRIYMRRFFVSFFVVCCALALSAKPQQERAEVILAKTAAIFKKNSGVKLDFVMRSFQNNQVDGRTVGTIHLKGEKFMLKAEGLEVWFNGRTQWSYNDQSQEVSVTTPTAEELQTINPYSFLNLYQQGYACRLGTLSAFNGRAVTEIILTSKDKRRELASITLYITKSGYQPVFVLLQQRGNKVKTEITVINSLLNQNFSDALFTYQKRTHPHAEIIDLR